LQADTVLTRAVLADIPDTLFLAEKPCRFPQRGFDLAMRVGDDKVLGDFQAMGHNTVIVPRFKRNLENYFRSTKRMQ